MDKESISIKNDNLLAYREQFIKDYYGDKGLPYIENLDEIIN